MATELGQRLSLARAERGWSLRELSRRTGVHNAHLSQIETGGIVSPDPNVLWALSDALGVDYGELLRLAGHINRVQPGQPSTVVGAALRTLRDLSPDEQRRALDFLERLRREGRLERSEPG